MKKLTIITVLFSIIFTFTSCDVLLNGLYSETDTRAHATSEVADSDMYVSAEVPIQEETDIDSGSPNQEFPTVLFPDEGEEMPTFENEDLNALVADLQAQGHDMKQLTFSDVGDSREVLYYTAQLSARAVQRGETLGFKITDLYFWCQSPDYDFNEFLDEVVTVCFVKDGSQNFLTQFQSVGDGVFLFTVPEDCEPGIYNVFLWVEEWTLLVAPVIVY